MANLYHLNMDNPILAIALLIPHNWLRIQPAFAMATSTPLVFLSADDRLLAIAQTARLLTDNPNNHP